MTGGYWAPIIIPIVAVIALFTWLGAVYYASAHPGWRTHSTWRAPMDYTSIRDPLDAVRKEPVVTPGPGAQPGQADQPGQPGATAPRPREPSESEQLERQSRERRLERRLRRDEGVGQGINRGQRPGVS
jgi:hypothetical protein